MKRSIIALSGFLLSTLALQHAAVAAEAADENSGALQEIIVTAEKREESAQKTPISMEVYTKAELAQKDIVDMQSLSATDTSLNFSTGGGEGYLTLRGVSSHDNTEIGSPSVPVSVDGFVSNRSWSLTSSLFDLERIEVLRGPQGTLYGRSATGGLVNVISNKPSKEFEASASVEYGNYNALNTTGVLNMPLSDMIQVRVAFSTRKHDGYRGDFGIDGFPVTEHADDEDSQAARLQVAIQPIDHLNILLGFEDIHVGGVGSAIQNVLFNPTADISHARPNLGNGVNFDLYGYPWQRIDSKIFKWNVGFDGLPGGAKLTYLGGFGLQEWHHSSPAGNTFFGNGFFGITGGADSFFPLRAYQQNEEPHTQNHEVRLTSNSDGPFTWQAGLYYFKEDNTVYSHSILNPNTPEATNIIAFTFPEVLQTSKAVFAQGSYQVSENGKVTVGARYNKDELERTGKFDLFIYGLQFPQNGEASSNKTTGHIGYDYTVSPSSLLYAKVDTGYKPGGFSTCGTYGPENVTSGEVGSKNRFDNDHFQVNVAGFFNNYKDQQISQFTSTCISGTTTTNAGGSHIYGVEAELAAVVDNVGKFDAGLSFLHARFTNFNIPPTIGAVALPDCGSKIVPVIVGGVTVGENCNLAGNALTQSPNFTVALGFTHTWDLAAGKLDWRVEDKYTTKQYFDSFNYNDTEQGGYSIGNTYLDYSQDKYTFGLFVRNFADARYLTFAAEATGGNAGAYQYSYGAPRTFGARFSVAIR